QKAAARAGSLRTDMDLTETAEEGAFRAEARAWLAANGPAEPLSSFDTAEGFEQHRAWEGKLYEGRWSAVSWPIEYGGRGADYIKWLIFEEEYYRAGAPGRVNQNGIFLLGPTIMEVGTDEQKGRFLPRMAAGQDIWCQGWSEPNAGSDLASIRSRAVLSDDGSEWILTGQKTWCSRGAFADWLFGIFRTDPSAERHRGLTFILVPLKTRGVTVRPIPQLDGETGFAEVFFEEARVSTANTLGDVDRGWQVAMATAGFERGVSLRSPARFTETANRLVDLYRQRGGDHHESRLRADVTAAWMDAEGYRLHTYLTVSRLLEGATIGAEASLNKIFWSEMDLKMHETAVQLLGHQALLQPTAPDAVDNARWLDGYLFSLSGPIYAGTNEIQRNVIGDRVLKLPRRG
ncbi:MAG TPA: acyl-CoA dehydrogenase family protein, partial [Acidimicrobiales bacterium]|nr:acyl-CoA dehydrogenase family protein [Acidimicrobiales bacterium]